MDPHNHASKKESREEKIKGISRHGHWSYVHASMHGESYKYNTSKMVKDGAISGWKNWIGAKNTITDGVAPQHTQKL